eukprot:gene6611-12148_t
MKISREIVDLVKCSPKREKILGEIKENIEMECDVEDMTAASMTKLSTTRWTVRATSFQRILENYDQIFQLWRFCLESGTLDSNAKARIIGCQNKMKSFEFFFALNLGQRLFVHTDNMSKTLQENKLSAISRKRLALLTKRTLESIRNTESFNSFYDTVLLKAKQHRFSQPCFEAYEKLESLLLKVLKSEGHAEELRFMEQTYGEDIDAQFPLFKLLFGENEPVCLDDILKRVTNFKSAELCLIGEVVTICKLLPVNPATSASAERSFSMARRLNGFVVI